MIDAKDCEILVVITGRVLEREIQPAEKKKDAWESGVEETN